MPTGMSDCGIQNEMVLILAEGMSKNGKRELWHAHAHRVGEFGETFAPDSG